MQSHKGRGGASVPSRAFGGAREPCVLAVHCASEPWFLNLPIFFGASQITTSSIAFSSLGNLSIYTLKGKPLTGSCGYSTWGVAGTFLLARLCAAGMGDTHELEGHPESRIDIFTV